MHTDTRAYISHQWPMRHNFLVRANLWNAINAERQRRMRYAGYRNGTWTPGSYPAHLNK